MEDSHIKDKVRFESFIKCIFISYAIAIKIGSIEELKQPVKMKKTLGCRAYSVLQLGIKLIKQSYIVNSWEVGDVVTSRRLPTITN
ncbi:hypothetical protein [Candidatus Tisiphia endosymbiont of Sialis lutaria]